MKNISKIGFGGGCHWCTEGIFQSLKGVVKVAQGWVSSTGEYSSFSEAIICHFDSEIISLETLIEIHLLTHSSTSDHSMRSKYRSAIYYFGNGQKETCSGLLTNWQANQKEKVITKVLPFRTFKANKPEFVDYLYSRKDNQFCTNYIHPKLNKLLQSHSNNLDHEKMDALNLSLNV